jgi:hypothetical protein
MPPPWGFYPACPFSLDGSKEKQQAYRAKATDNLVTKWKSCNSETKTYNLACNISAWFQQHILQVSFVIVNPYPDVSNTALLKLVLIFWLSCKAYIFR